MAATESHREQPGYPPGRMRAWHAAYYLGISETELRRGAGDKYPPATKDGGVSFWRKKDLDAYINAVDDDDLARATQAPSLREKIRARA